MKQSSNLEKILSAVALLIVGACLVIWSDKVTKWIAIALGVISLIVAAVRVAKYLQASPENRPLFGLFGIVPLTVIGIVLVTKADFVKEAISFIVGFYIVFSCMTQLMTLSALRRRDVPTKSYFWPVVGVIIGILCIVGRFIVPNALVAVAGIALIVYAVVYLIGLGMMNNIIKEAKPRPSHKEVVETSTIQEAEIIKKPAKKTKQKTKK